MKKKIFDTNGINEGKQIKILNKKILISSEENFEKEKMFFKNNLKNREKILKVQNKFLKNLKIIFEFPSFEIFLINQEKTFSIILSIK